jgi:hypothetical protein
MSSPPLWREESLIEKWWLVRLRLRESRWLSSGGGMRMRRMRRSVWDVQCVGKLAIIKLYGDKGKNRFSSFTIFCWEEIISFTWFYGKVWTELISDRLHDHDGTQQHEDRSTDHGRDPDKTEEKCITKFRFPKAWTTEFIFRFPIVPQVAYGEEEKCAEDRMEITEILLRGAEKHRETRGEREKNTERERETQRERERERERETQREREREKHRERGSAV